MTFKPISSPPLLAAIAPRASIWPAARDKAAAGGFAGWTYWTSEFNGEGSPPIAAFASVRKQTHFRPNTSEMAYVRDSTTLAAHSNIFRISGKQPRLRDS